MLLPLLLVLATIDPQHALEDWARARGRAFDGDVTARPAIWRERAPGATLRDFTPPGSLAPLIRAVSPGVVNVVTYQSPGDGIPAGRVPAATGSGFLLGPEGYAVTNHHVVKGAEALQIRLSDGRVFDAQLVGADPGTDVALIRAETGGARDIPSVMLGDSDTLEVGDWVVAIGNPFGLERSVAHGLISAKERVLGVGAFDDFLQTDALINPGNSGGPLFNMRGEVVGMATAVVTHAQGIGFAVPINMVKDLLPNLLDNGHLERGWLGLTVAEQPSADGRSRVAVVQDVFPASPAATAGLRPGDRITHVNGRPFDSYLALLRRISLLAPGTLVRLSVQRGATPPRELVARVGEPPAQRPAPVPEVPAVEPPREDLLGLTVADLDADAAQRLRARGPGVWVQSLEAGGLAARAGLRVGDVVVEVDGRRVTSAEDFHAAVVQYGEGKKLTLRLERRGQSRSVVLGGA
ncbi:MAG: trypsin-like peptidase domain-containing protein [Myxococcaceae bacterium]